MSYRPIPSDPEGYALAPHSREVHTRYARHVPGLRKVRTLDGVYTLIGEYAEPVPCDTCYPPPPRIERPRARRQAEPDPVEIAVEPEPEATGSLDGLTLEAVTLGPVDPEPEG